MLNRDQIQASTNVQYQKVFLNSLFLLLLKPFLRSKWPNTVVEWWSQLRRAETKEISVLCCPLQAPRTRSLITWPIVYNVIWYSSFLLSVLRLNVVYLKSFLTMWKSLLQFIYFNGCSIIRIILSALDLVFCQSVFRKRFLKALRCFTIYQFTLFNFCCPPVCVVCVLTQVYFIFILFLSNDALYWLELHFNNPILAHYLTFYLTRFDKLTIAFD